MTPEAELSLIFGHRADYWRPGLSQPSDNPPDNSSKGAAVSIGSCCRYITCVIAPGAAGTARWCLLGCWGCCCGCSSAGVSAGVGGSGGTGTQQGDRDPPGRAEHPPSRRHRGAAAGGRQWALRREGGGETRWRVGLCLQLRLRLGCPLGHCGVPATGLWQCGQGVNLHPIRARHRPDLAPALLLPGHREGAARVSSLRLGTALLRP